MADRRSGAEGHNARPGIRAEQREPSEVDQRVSPAGAGITRLRLLKRQAEAGDIVLLFGDESEVLTHPYLTAPGPGAAPICGSRRPARRALLGFLDGAAHKLIVQFQFNNLARLQN